MEQTEGARSSPDAGRAGASRLRVLQLLRDSADDLGVQDIAERVGLHVNTVRFHLDRLVTEGLVLRHVEERTEPGRPRLAFTAAPRPDRSRDQRSYRLLSEILASFVTGAVPDAAAQATEAGRQWGHYLTERPAPYRRTSEQDAVTELLRTLDEVGFQPELSPEGPHGQVLLRHCPFLEVAAEHRDVVCSIHLGLMQGALAEMRAPITADRLEPFVAPSLCVAHLAAVTDHGEAT